MIAPPVSIIVLCHNQVAFTRRALAAIFQHTAEDLYELIVVDNGSSDDTARVVDAVATERPGVRLIRNDANLGFGGGNNVGAAAAHGEWLFFLNNDAEVQEGWLPALLDLAVRRPDAGAIGCQLVFPDGRLQEAGGVIFRDASGWNLGRFDDPGHPDYAFVREVDYASGAALLVRRALFSELGGFDRRYDPAYYEDVDLCFAIRAAGSVVLYQPRAKVIHFEGATAGTDVGAGAKRHQLENRPVFARKWADALTRQPLPPTGSRDARLVADRSTRNGRRVLFLIDRTITARTGLDGIDAVRRVRAEGHHVTCLVHGDDPPADDGTIDELRQSGILAVATTPSTLDGVMARLIVDDAHDRLAVWPPADLRLGHAIVEAGLGGTATPRKDDDDAGHTNASRDLPFVAGITPGRGFHPDGHRPPWIGAAAELFVWSATPSRPRVLTFEATSAPTSTALSFPLTLRVGLGHVGELARATFVAGSQTQVISLELAASHDDVRVWLECDGNADSTTARGGTEQATRVLQIAGLTLVEARPDGVHVDTTSQPGPAQVNAAIAPTGAPQPNQPYPWRCNVCGHHNRSTLKSMLLDEHGRESRSCAACGSWIRVRTIVHLLSQALFGRSLALPDFPVRKDIRGIGLSDWEGYATPLAERLNYTNAFFHQEPRLDIMAVPAELLDTLDFLISSEVFEHVPPPVAVAFENAYRLLRPGGALVFSVPYTLWPSTREHFPDLHEWTIREVDGRAQLHNRTADGRMQVFDDLTFHGGDGATLEMRIFCEADVLAHLARAGFRVVDICRQPHYEFGIHWPNPWSIPMLAIK